MDALWSLLTLLGSALCHQLKERSYTIDDLQMPLCARCIGIHFGFLTSASMLLAAGRDFRARLPSNRGLVTLSIVMAFFFIDAGLSYSGISDSTNLRRTLGGLALGTTVPLFVLPIAVAASQSAAFSQLRMPDARLGMLFLLAFLISAALTLSSERSKAVFYVVSVLGISGMVVFLVAMWSAIVSLSFDDRRVSRRTRISLASACSLAMMVVLILAHSAV